MTHPAARRLAWAVITFLAMSVVGCSDDDAPAQHDAGQQAPPVTPEQLPPTVDRLETDRTNVDEVAHDFVTIVETHDASVDVDEWSSLHRAVDLMLPSLAKAQLAYTAGSADSDWEQWQNSNAYVTPTVNTTRDARPDDTDDRAQRVFRAQLRLEPENDEEELPSMERVHFVTLEKTDGRWSVSVWQPGPLEESHQQEAGEISREDEEG